MLPYERQNELLSLFTEGKIVHPEDIVERFGVSIATARRDLHALEQLPNIKKVYGGAVMTGPEPTDAPLRERQISYTDEKDRIGRYCASLIEDGDMVLLDNGTTPMYIARYLKDRDVTVITNSILVIEELAESRPDIIVLGGRLKKKELSVAGSSTVKEIRNFNIAKSFLSTSGIALKSGISDYNQDEIDNKREAISRSRMVFIVSDRSKVNFTAPRHLCDLSEITMIVTDAGLSTETARRFSVAGIPVERV